MLVDFASLQKLLLSIPAFGKEALWWSVEQIFRSTYQVDVTLWLAAELQNLEFSTVTHRGIYLRGRLNT